jgi:hypothetical protein
MELQQWWFIVFNLRGKRASGKINRIFRQLACDRNNRRVSSATVKPMKLTLQNFMDRLMEPTMDKHDKFDKLFDILKDLRLKEFTGSLKINFSQGGVGRIEKLEEMVLKAKK